MGDAPWQVPVLQAVQVPNAELPVGNGLDNLFEGIFNPPSPAVPVAPAPSPVSPLPAAVDEGIDIRTPPPSPVLPRPATPPRVRLPWEHNLGPDRGYHRLGLRLSRLVGNSKSTCLGLLRLAVQKPADFLSSNFTLISVLNQAKSYFQICQV